MYNRTPSIANCAQTCTLSESAVRKIIELASHGAGSACDLDDLWHELCSGVSRMLAGFHDNDYAYLVVSSPLAACNHANAQEFALLEQWLLGTAHKVIAYDLKRATATVAGRIARALRATGCPVLASRTPLLFAMAASTQVVGARFRARKTRVAVDSHGTLYVVQSPRPERCVRNLLTPSEFKVASALLEGKSYAAIAKAREVSVRTVANQTASVFRKLGISGRRELLAYVVRLHRPASNDREPLKSEITEIHPELALAGPQSSR